MINNTLVFDIETVPDTLSGRRLYNLEGHGLSNREVAEAMVQIKRRGVGDSDFLPLHLQRIVAISVVLRSYQGGVPFVKVWSLGDLQSEESELIKRFFEGVEKFAPTLVSWNGSGFDLPVLHYRALLHGIVASRYWEVGDGGEYAKSYRYNNYLSRYHWRHIDLMDVLAGYQLRGAAPLTEIAVMLGFPGKMGMEGSQVWEAYLGGEQESIRHYCETDVLNTYLIFLRFQLMRGYLDMEQYQYECQLVRDYLAKEQQPHFQAFLEAWQS